MLYSHHDEVSPDIIQLKDDRNIAKREKRVGWMCGIRVVAARSNCVEMNRRYIRNVKQR